MACDAELCPGTLLVFLVLSLGFRSGCGSVGFLKLLRHHLGINFLGTNGARRQDGDDVVPHLGEATINEEKPGRVAAADSQLAIAQPAYERRPPGQDAKFTVVKR